MSKKGKATSPTPNAGSTDVKHPVRDKSPVAQMITWTESVRKEKSAIKIYESFTINPKNS